MSLVSLFKKKTKAADRFEQLIRPKVETLYRIAYRLCNSQDDAEDLVQQLLIRIFPKLDWLETIEKLDAWLASSLYNLYVDKYRRSVREKAIFSHDDEFESLADTAQSPFEQVSNNQIQQTIEIALSRLNDNQRIVVLLHDAEGYTMEELTIILEVPLGTIKSRLNRARRALKKMLAVTSLYDIEESQQKTRISHDR